MLANETESSDQCKMLIFRYFLSNQLCAALKIGIIIQSETLRYSNSWYRYFISQKREWEDRVWYEWFPYLLTITEHT
jgi:hypothetical protein